MCVLKPVEQHKVCKFSLGGLWKCINCVWFSLFTKLKLVFSYKHWHIFTDNLNWMLVGCTFISLGMKFRWKLIFYILLSLNKMWGINFMISCFFSTIYPGFLHSLSKDGHFIFLLMNIRLFWSHRIWTWWTREQ